MDDTLLYIIFIIACLCTLGVGFALGRTQGWQEGFAACSEIWSGDDDDAVLDAKEIK